MKRTCNGCKALAQTHKFYCELGYKLEPKKEIYGVVVECKPSEECPKPKTFEQLMDKWGG